MAERVEKVVGMGKRGHMEGQILRAQREAGTGSKVVEVCRRHGISQQSFLSVEEKVHGFWDELEELRQLLEENNKPKRLVADLSHDSHILHEIATPTIRWRGLSPSTALISTLIYVKVICFLNDHGPD